MARDLAAQETFPDLQGWEDSALKLQEAKTAVVALKRAMAQVTEEVHAERERAQSRKRAQAIQAESRRSQESLVSLNQRLIDLARLIGTQQAGYDFQTWFYDLMDFFEIVNRRPYTTGGRQIDGSITVSGTTYLVELKFTTQQSDATDIDTIRAKINDKADNTMGIIVSMSGYSSVAINQASGPRTPLLLMDSRHVYFALTGAMPFGEIVDRVRRHGSQTGEAFLPPDAF
jgi:hypothetical protein